MSRSAAVSALLFGLGACSDGLVYGERSGFNLAIRSDPAASAPIEVNSGLQRRVVVSIPPSGQDAAGRPAGEGVNMFSRFDVRRVAGDGDTDLGGKVRISTSFVSGSAAKAIAAKPEIVGEVIKAPVFTAVTAPAEVEVARRLLDYTAGPGNAERYLELARAEGLAISPGAEAVTRAVGTVLSPANAAGNRVIAERLNL
ncbi:MAG TPA: hypothetical protein DEB47_22385 [Citreicella sp.]|jgi:hypothetical protein|nr:hypothetical protein [Citreicella sp.]